MILYKVVFGLVPRGKREEAEDAIESYLSILTHNGQAIDEPFLVVQQGLFCAYINLAGINALAAKYESEYEERWRKNVTDLFDQAPVWTLVDDEVPKRDITWNKAPFLYLFTSHWSENYPPISRGDTGKSIPLYRCLDTHDAREKIYFWQQAYRDHDSIFLKSGKLEIPAYKELATPESELSQEGREICQKVESATGIPTYYYLMRYWGRRKGEENRTCPGCGKPWRTQHETKGSKFSAFHFKCNACRLVSHMANAADDERHAVIGEWRHRRA